MTQIARGYYQDTMTVHGEQVRWAGPWHPNLIVQPCNVLLAALMKGQENMDGILYWAVGAGEQAWDRNPPEPQPTRTQLVNEVGRTEVKPKQIVFLDYADRPTNPSSPPTHRLEVTAVFKGADLVANDDLTLREFGLFGGNATDVQDSGLMIDYVVHPRIHIAADTILSRKVRLTFAASGIAEEVLSGFGAELPVSNLDGIGSNYRGILHGLGINTLGKMVEIDPLQPVSGIPLGKMREFRTKARLVMNLRLSPGLLWPLRNFSVSRLLKKHPDDFAGSGVTPEMVQQLQESLAILQVALDEAKLKDIKLEDLLHTRA